MKLLFLLYTCSMRSTMEWSFFSPRIIKYFLSYTANFRASLHFCHCRALTQNWQHRDPHSKRAWPKCGLKLALLASCRQWHVPIQPALGHVWQWWHSVDHGKQYEGRLLVGGVWPRSVRWSCGPDQAVTWQHIMRPMKNKINKIW